MKILVTGGAGFIGSNFIHYWLKHHPDDSIINLDKLTYAGNLENLEAIANQPNYSFVKGDITDYRLVSELVGQVDCIVHFAAESHVDRSISSPQDFITTNVLGTFTLLEAAKKNQTRFHHISTDEVFGSLTLDQPEKFTESTPYNPSSPYSASKASSDHLVRAYFKTFKLPITISNTSNNYGPYQFPEKLISLAITNALENKPIPIYGNGSQRRDWLYVEDHCIAIDLILTKGKLGETYLIGGQHQDVSNLDLIKQILTIAGKSEDLIQFVADRPGHDVRYDIDWSKANRELGYTPAHDLTTYLTQTITWYQNHQSWWQRVKSGQYQQYYQQQYHP